VAADLTIEQLAAATGMTVRNIRAHQARGLLAPPEVRLRVGYYGPEHVAQLRLIRELQDDGFNLGGIKRLLGDTQGTAERLLNVKLALSDPDGAEAPEMLTLAVLAEIERHCDSVSRSFVKLFLAEVWKPFAQADMPPERWPEIESAVERLRPIAGEALIAIFRQRLSTQIEGAFREMARRMAAERVR
jgi:DNA-binding transcriptional MerR regulator